MRKAITFVLAVLFTASVAQADITSIDMANDGDGAINCLADTSFTGSEGTVDVTGDQFWGPGHMIGTITSDTALDPTLLMLNQIDNETGFAWTGYDVNIKMSSTFLISNVSVSNPADWTFTITQPTLQGSEYIGTISYVGGTAVQPLGTFDFGYAISFDGATSYQFCQEMVPVPEPVTMSLLGLGGLVMLRRRK
jgi:hypothetical protein